MKIRLLVLILSFLSISICRSQSTTHYLWFDENTEDVVTVTGDRLTADIDVGTLKPGLHSLRYYARMADGTVTTPQCALFLKTDLIGKEQSIHCIVRVDNSFNKEMNSNMADGLVHLDVDMSDIPDGLHQISVQIMPEGCSVPISTTTSYFLKEASVEDGVEIDCHAIIDNGIQRVMRCTPTGGVINLNLDMQELTNGVHQITIYLVPVGSTTIMDPFTAFFIKMPVGGSRITRYSYWFDDNSDDMVSFDCDEDNSTVEFLGLIDAEVLPFKSSSYAFGLDGDDVVLTSKHDFNFMALDNIGRLSNTQTKTYTDERSQKTISADAIENLTNCVNKKVGIIEDNDIKFYKFYAEVGDSLSMNLSKPASFELYSPTAKTVIEKKGRLSESLSTAVLVETGMYYLAIHDIDGKNKNNESLTFNHVPRNAILSASPSVIAAPVSFFCVDLFGNGFDNVRSLILKNDSGISYEVDSIYVHDNYHLTAAIEYGSEIPYGDYLLSLLVDDEVSGKEVLIQYPKNVKIDEKQSNAKINVEVIPSKKASTPYMVDVKVTNDSDVPCWGIPFNVACELNDEDGEEQIKYTFFMKDFFGWDVPLDSFDWYETDNLLGTETPGIMLPMVISYLNPHETRILRVGIESEAHQKLGLYAWTGEPYNETADRILNMTPEEMQDMKFRTSNIFTLDTYAYILWIMEEMEAEFKSKPAGLMRAPSDNDQIFQFMADHGIDALSHIEGLGHSVDLAQTTASIYSAVGKTMAGIVNSSSNMHAYRYFKDQCDIPGKTLSEQIAYIYSHKMQNQTGIDIYLDQVAKNMARTASPQRIVAELAEDLTDLPISDVMDCYSEYQSQNPDPRPRRHRIESLQSYDPNDMTGYSDLNGGPYVGIDVKHLQYKIEFENDPKIANASASVVKVENYLDGSVFDLSSYKPLTLQIGNLNIALPDETSFVKTIDMRPSINCILEIRHEYDETTGKSLWTFVSLDPISLDIVGDSHQGFLPVNDSNGIGVGEIEYCIDIKADLSHNAVLSNKANIIFDDNEAIETPEWVNVTDYIRPNGKIVNCEVSPDRTSYAFDVDCSDEGSGLNSYDLCAKTKDSDKWVVVKPDITGSRVEYSLTKPIEGIEFAVRATDNAGNQQTSFDDQTSAKNVIESDGQTDAHDELWYNVNGVRVDKSNSVNKPIISNTRKRVVILK